MDTPFVFGRLAVDEEFTNREGDLDRLLKNFSAGINTVLISPRRWGKSSLVAKASLIATKKNRNTIFCMIDLFNVRNEEQFYQSYAQELIRASSGKWQERIENTKAFISRFIPKITYSPDPMSDFSIGLDWKEVKKHPDEIIDLAEKIAKKKKVKLVVCIDEFQNIGEFEHPLELQKKLRSHWQKHQNVTYCLYGSKRHMMMEVFSSASMPFYKFGELIFLQKIAAEHWEKFIVRRFKDTGKRISPELAKNIAHLADLHPYYVQQLAQQAWLRSGKICNDSIVKEAFENLLLQLSLLFQNITDNLTDTQLNFIKAILENTEQLSSKETLMNYRLGTSANVLRAKDALVSKEIIDIENNNVNFLDPMYKAWLKKFYFKIME